MSNTWFVDLLNGLDTHTGVSFAQRVKTLSKAAALASAGDTVRVMGNLSTTSGTANWTNGSPLVTLSAGLTQLLYADGAWTAASTKITCAAPTSSPSPKEGTSCASMACASTFTTGKVASFPTGSALNLSAYQQVSFWVQSNVALASGAISLDLCSDTAGNTIVDTMTVPVALNAGQWTNVTIDHGAALGASIQSLRLTAHSTLASKTIIIDNVMACKATSSAGCLTLGTLISPDNATWYHIQGINGTNVYLDALAETPAQGAPGFQGATVSGSTFYLLKPTQVAIGASGVFAQSFSKDGAAGSQLTISGGWDSTAMTSQTGWTTIDMMDWVASGVNLTGTVGYLTLDHFNFVRCRNTINFTNLLTGCVLSNSTWAGIEAIPVLVIGGLTIASCNFLNSQGGGINPAITIEPPSAGNAGNITSSNFFGCRPGGLAVVGSGLTITGCNASGSIGSGFTLPYWSTFNNNIANNNTNGGFNFTAGPPVVAFSLTALGNSGGDVQVNGGDVQIYGLNTNTPGGSSLPQIFFPQFSNGELVVYNWTQYTGTTPAAQLCGFGDVGTGYTSSGSVYAHRENGLAADNSIYSDYGNMTTTGVVGESGSGIAWKLAPNANTAAVTPLRLSVGKIACPASYTTSITYWAQLSASSGISSQLRIFGGRYPGVGSIGADITTPVSGTAWAQYTISVTPTEGCVVEVFFETWGSSTQTATVSGPATIVQ